MNNPNKPANSVAESMAVRQSMPFFSGPNLFNHTTVGKIIRFESSDYGFICLQCGSNYQDSAHFLAHIETHYPPMANQSPVVPNPTIQVGTSESSASSEDDNVLLSALPIATSPRDHKPSQPIQPTRPLLKRASMSMGGSAARLRKPLSTISCFFCSCKFRSKSRYEQHKTIEHGAILKRLKNRDGLLMCSLCGHEFTKRQQAAAERHMRVHVDQNEI